MNKNETKTINVIVSNETWKKIKILGIQKDLTLIEICKELLEKSVSNKKVSTTEINKDSD